MQTKEQILELRYNRLANTNQSTPWNKVPTIYKTIALEAMELYASQRQGAELEWKPMVEPPEDDQLCLFIRRPVVEPPYLGSMIDNDFTMIPDYYTHYAELRNRHFDESEASPTSQPAQGESDKEIWPFYGYAPGNYQNTCSICKKEVIVDKLCFVCLECAIAKSRSATHPSPEPVAAQGVEEAARYVAGFFFDTSCDNVWLIKKNKPKWQKGLLNGIGGKIEPGETSAQAMMREFIEETGHNPYGIWKQFCTLKGKDWSVDFYYVIAEETQEFEKPYTTTDEEVIKVSISELHDNATISNLTWLIQLACDTEIYGIDYNISAGASFIQSQHPPPVKQAMEFAPPSDFTLWVVVNKWQYDYKVHKWWNDYIGEVKGVVVTHDELYELFIQSKNK